MANAPWWHGAVIYHVYLRSYFDSNADGYGDLQGLIQWFRNVWQTAMPDAVWLSPIHPSPNRDWGYDVSDYESVHPDYGTLEDFDQFLKLAHAYGVKVLLDEVLCHTSDEHPWFRNALAGGDKKDWYVWADPKPDGTAPNNWLSAFGGPAWSYRPERRRHYHHKFLRQQPKLNWRNAAAKKAALDVLEFWLQRGVDGFRLDVANAFLHDAALADNPAIPAAARGAFAWSHDANMQDHVNDSNLAENLACLNEIRQVVERYGPERFVFGEFSEGYERSGGYAGPTQGLHAGYTFDLLRASKLSPDFVREHIALCARHPDYYPCIAFSNHDVARAVTRFGGGSEGNPALAKLLIAILLTLRGTSILYQGDELGLPQVELRRDQLRDPVGELYYPVSQGRDGSRTPLPWYKGSPNSFFTRGTPWLPVGAAHDALSIMQQQEDPNSTLNFTLDLMRKNDANWTLRLGDIVDLDAPAPVLAYKRRFGDDRGRDGMVCAFNMSAGEAEFRHPDVRTARGSYAEHNVVWKDDTLVFGPYGLWIG